MPPTRIGVIGCGFFARFHLHAWRDLAKEGAQLIAVCDIDAAKAELAAKKFGVERWYTDSGRMLAEENLDLVDIATRMETHLTLVRQVLQRGLAIVVQKPLAPNRDEAVAIVEAAERANCFLAIHENFRFQAPMQETLADQ